MPWWSETCDWFQGWMLRFGWTRALTGNLDCFLAWGARGDVTGNAHSFLFALGIGIEALSTGLPFYVPAQCMLSTLESFR